MNNQFQIHGYEPKDIVTNGNRFLAANGRLGLRGNLDEHGKDELAAINVAGVYDRNGEKTDDPSQEKWREPINAPNGLMIHTLLGNKPLMVGKSKPTDHTQIIDFSCGRQIRETTFPQGVVRSERIASMAQTNLLAAKYTVTFAEPGDATVYMGITTNIWDINGPHLFDTKAQTGDVLHTYSRTGELNIPIRTYQAVNTPPGVTETQDAAEEGVLRTYTFAAEAGKPYTFEVFYTVYAGDVFDPEEAHAAAVRGIDAVFAAHDAVWAEIWANSKVAIEGDDAAQLALTASQYHLHSISPRHSNNLSIPARGLSGQTYKGAIFWDSEIFLFPFFAYTEPEVAKTLLRYRIETLDGARKKAAEYGYRGAFYAWESQEGGIEGCSDYNVTDVFTHRPVRTYFRDKQIHISADVAFALWQYLDITGDLSLMQEGGAEVLCEVARFFLSRCHQNVDTGKIELLDVIGPDEYHERVNNSLFTNTMAANAMDACLQTLDLLPPDAANALIAKLDFAADRARLAELLPHLRPSVFSPAYHPSHGSLSDRSDRQSPPVASGEPAQAHVFEQFDGYFKLEDCSLSTVRSRVLDDREYWGSANGVAAHTQIIKQADVIALLALFPDLCDTATVQKNWEYYEPRTEHGSSLSACMYALTACAFGRADLAWEHFIKTASIDLAGGGKHWAGEIYIGGTHPAANGGAWMIAAFGFAGMRIRKGEVSFRPNLPEKITKLTIPFALNGAKKLAVVTRNGATVTER